MPSLRRKVPEWRHLVPQINKAIKEKEEDGCDHEDTLYLDAAPSIQFRYSCGLNYLQCVTTFTGRTGPTVVGFQWGHKMVHHQMKVWTQNMRGRLCHYKSVPLENDYKVEHLVFVPGQRVFVGACSDLSLRVFSDPGLGLVLQYRAVLLGSVLCMHYCRETEELLTGGLGIITFWGFRKSRVVELRILRVLDWSCCSLRRDTTINALITEQQTSTIYALCGHRIKCFHVRSKEELRAFSGQETLRCVSSDPIQHYLYTGDITGHVQVWSWDTKSLQQEFLAHSCCVSSIVLHPNTRNLLTSSQDGWVKEWSLYGELLTKLFLGDPGGICSLWLIDEHQVLCHSYSSLSIWHLQDIHQPFHSNGCSLQHLQRFECGPSRARILVTGQDSIARIISPVDGEMLLLSWPFLQMEQALDFAYKPGREELFVAFGTPEVLVLDLTQCPCPVKRILCVSKNDDQDESVMSLEAVMTAGSDWASSCLVFSGHRNGNLQLLSATPKLRCQARKTHGGAILQMSSLSGPKAQLCCYGAEEQLTVWAVEVGAEVKLDLIIKINCHSKLMLTQLTAGFIVAVSPTFSLRFYSLSDKRCSTMERNPPTAITCLDYCEPLGLVALSGPAGIVEIWDAKGTQLTEIQLGAPVDQVCFANARGDLLACFSGSISIITALRYLPARLLKQVLQQAPGDDLLEAPVPFLPQSSSCYDLGAVPRMMPGEVTPEPEISQTAGENVQSQDVDWKREISEKTITPAKRKRKASLSYLLPTVKPKDKEEVPTMQEAVLETLDQLTNPGQPVHTEPADIGWPVAPDGFIPNSVIRNWRQSQKPQEPEISTKPKALKRVFLQEPVKVRKVKAQRAPKPVTPVENHEPQLEEKDVSQNLLENKTQSQCLDKAPEISELESVTKAVMMTMNSTDASVYNSCTETLFSLWKAHNIPPKMKKQHTVSLIQDIQKRNPHWKRLDGLKTLVQLALLQEKHMFVVAEVLTDPMQELRQLAREGMTQVYHISTKEMLLARLRNIRKAPARRQLIKHLDTQLTEDLQLKEAFPAETPKLTRELTGSCDQIVSSSDVGVDNESSVNYRPQLVVKEEKQERIWASGVKRYSPAQQAPPPEDVSTVHVPTVLLKPPHHTKKKYRKVFKSPSLKEMIRSEPTTEGLVDPLIINLYKKLKNQRLAKSSSHKVIRPLVHHETGVLANSSLVQLPPITRSELFHLEPNKGPVDPNWRENLHQLTSRFGFRSQKAAQLATQDKLRALKTQDYPAFKLPPVCSSQLTLGQRVMERVQVKETRPSHFHHILPLPGQLNIHTIKEAGESQYGRMNVNWRAKRLERPQIQLPPIVSRRVTLVPQGGSVS